MKRLLILSALAMFFTGCMVGPNYQKPKVSLPAGWRSPASTASSLGELKWWALFKDPALGQLIRTALDQNKNLLIAAARVTQAQAELGVTRANQYPEIDAGASMERERLSRTGSFPLPASFSSQLNLFSISPQISYQTDFWGQYRRATAAARANLLATEEAQRNVIISVVSGVAQGYFTLRELDSELQITQRTVASYQDSLHLTRIRFEGGVASELDVRQAETQLYTAQATIPAFEQQIGQEEDTISILLGQNPEAIPRGLALTEQPLPLNVPAGLPSQLLERRPDIMQAEDQLIAASEQIGIARAQFFPQIPLTGSGGFQSSQLSSLFAGPAGVFQLAANLTAPVFTAGRLRSNLRAVQAEYRETLISYQQTIQQALREVDDSLIAYQKTLRQRTADEALVTAAQKAVDLSNIRYRNGVATYLDVLDSERTLFSAQLSLAQVQGNTLVSVVQLYEALGGGWQP
ncbi:MAG: efflux transporter outer membrane subunit [Terriglobia bacterium]